MEVSPATGRGGLSSHRPGQRKIPKENTLWPVQTKIAQFNVSRSGHNLFCTGQKAFSFGISLCPGLWLERPPRPVAGETSMGLF